MHAEELTPDHLGRYTIPGGGKDKGAFKTPSLRNFADTAPYMHEEEALQGPVTPVDVLGLP